MSALNSIPNEALSAMADAWTALSPRFGSCVAIAANGIDSVAPTANALMILWANLGFGDAGAEALKI